ncbi:NAD-dependent epimerase/dehydratase family protein [Microvirga tunisiensis]|uniref:NAD-dependent epimerase/dehydratase family protein n=2 Tax=Pannonibacter tanglangensis TaxID=2750084 RepID=A0A7X5F0P7_9HYPH|nr:MULTISPECIES: GDP-mannose 4,6-dehydratase [unclassified Pannonibacter]NBN63984.1 NAD-dependent epimerase/dehydratase family protein [Pannonibacter sp. XCT-34]NBN77621.1 NAD-dependent epimerase/dehydratase family protein [Pannonibacter sp. XCT-53]
MLSEAALEGRVLVTGAGGFAARHLLPRLARHVDPELGHAAVFGPSGPDSAPTLPQGFRALSCDLTDAGAIDALIAAVRPDHVIHLAAQSSVGASFADGGRRTWSVNFDGTAALAGALLRHAPAATLLFASTVEVYGLAFRAGRLDETAATAPQNPYARSKRAAEDFLQDTLAGRLPLIIARLTNHSGAGQSAQFVLPSFARQIARIEAGLEPPVLLVGNLDAERDFLHVDDVIDAELTLLTRSTSLAHQVYNVASGTPVPIRALLQRLLALAACPIEVRQDPARLRPSDIPRVDIDPGRLIGETGWRPGRSLDQLLAGVLEDQRRQIAGQPGH